MKFTKSLWFAAISAALLLLLAATAATATKRPRYGGTLRVELFASSVSLDPREWKSGALSAREDEKLAALVYERLVTLDDYGKFQPALAIEWSHDDAAKNWQFKLRPGVKFSDGSVLTSADVVASLQSLLPAGLQLTATDTAISIHSPHPIPDLLEQLASSRHFVFRTLPDDTLLGTGPFYVAEISPAAPYEANPTAMKPARLKFRANEQSWAGRPFLDAIEVTLGEPPLRQLFDLQVGRADVVEVAPDLVRKARQDNLRVWSSAPKTLLALRFDEAQPASADEHLREALALSLDRDTMANVLLQKQAEPAPALLPNWLSGYAFLFESPMNLERAKEIRASLPANEAGGTEPLRLRVDAGGDLMKLLGERVAVNARQANLSVQVVTHSTPAIGGAAPVASNNPSVGLHLFAWHYDSLSPRAELEAMVNQLHLGRAPESTQQLADPEQRYTAERRMLEERRVLPLVLLPEYVGIAAPVRNWMPARWGEWRLAEVWIEKGESAPAAPNGGASPENSAAPHGRGVHP
ncbi:MAG: ABC transporter substrate-binding protein [Candidatus Acidiferrum sp.]